MIEDNSFETEIYDYKIEFLKGDEPVDVPDIKAAMIIKSVLSALDIKFDEIKIKQIVTGRVEATKDGITVDFIGDVPEYWYAEADIREKAVEIAMDEYKMRIPLYTILRWFEESKDKRDMK